jgi:hypothetical protein
MRHRNRGFEEAAVRVPDHPAAVTRFILNGKVKIGVPAEGRKGAF